MEATTTRLREAIPALGRTKRNTPVPAPLRAEVMAFASEQRLAGYSLSTVQVSPELSNARRSPAPRFAMASRTCASSCAS